MNQNVISSTGGLKRFGSGVYSLAIITISVKKYAT